MWELASICSGRLTDGRAEQIHEYLEKDLKNFYFSIHWHCTRYLWRKKKPDLFIYSFIYLFIFSFCVFNFGARHIMDNVLWNRNELCFRKQLPCDCFVASATLSRAFLREKESKKIVIWFGIILLKAKWFSSLPVR